LSVVLTLRVGFCLTVRCLGAEFFSPDQRLTQVFSLPSSVVGSLIPSVLLFELVELFELFELSFLGQKTVLVLYLACTRIYR
jgi:hypothetical protein